MIRRRALDAVLLVAFVGAAVIFVWILVSDPTRKGGASSDGAMDSATVEAWKQAGAVVESAGSVEKGELPRIRTTQAITVETLARLPKPVVPFVLIVDGWYPTVEELKHLTNISTLARVHIPGITDEILKHFAAVGFHRLSRARAAGGKHPTTPEEIVELDLANSYVTSDGLKHLPALKNLSTLDLAQTPVTDAGLQHLASLANLTNLNLQQTKVTDAGLAHLANLKRLTTLNLLCPQVTEAGLKHLTALNLTSLSLPSGVTDAGLEQVATLTSLTELDLYFTKIRSGGLKHLSGLKKLTKLRVNLREVGLKSPSDAGLLHTIPQATAADGKRPASAEEVVHLNLHGEWVFDFDLPRLAVMKNLATLDVSHTGVTGTGLKHLTNLTNLTNLKLGFNLQGSEVVDETLEYLVAFPKLSKLSLSSGLVTDRGLKHLMGLNSLTELDVRGTKITAAGAAEFQKALPGCKVTW